MWKWQTVVIHLHYSWRSVWNCAIISTIYCLLVVILGWVIFRSDTLLYAVRYILRMILPFKYGISSMFNLSVSVMPKTIIVLFLALLGCGLLQEILKKSSICLKWKYSKLEAAYLTVVFICCLILLAAGTYNPFIYFRF